MVKRSLIFIALFALLGAGGWIANRFHLQHKEHRATEKAARLQALSEEKPFVIIIPSYNNSKWCVRNLRSVLEQKYANFRVIYIDDASKDDTYQKVKEYVALSQSKVPFTLIHNEKNRGALANLYTAIHSCRDEEIVVLCDGDDHLANEYVLEKLNRVYANPNTWMTYGNFLNYPTFTQKPVTCKPIPARVINNNSYRKSEWISSHLRTFYSGLFKKIKLEDLLYEGGFMPMAWDVAFMVPLLEMSARHAVFIKEILYLYNRENPISDHIVNLKLQSSCNHHARSLRPYTPLKQLRFSQETPSTSVADLIVFSFDRPLQLYALLESAQKEMTNLGKTTVIYRSSSPAFENAYQKVQQKFPAASFLKESEEPHHDFQTLTRQALAKTTDHSDYLLFAVDDIIIKDRIDCARCIQAMEATKAWGVFLRCGKNLSYCYAENRPLPLPKHVSISDDLCAWQFGFGTDEWRYPNTLDMTLYRREDVIKDLSKISFSNPTELESKWAQKSKRKRVGLFFEESRIINLPVNVVTKTVNRHANSYSTTELLSLFNEGKKLDIAPFSKIKNISCHTEADLLFIPREP